ncbi:K+ transporter 1 [Perilla frutescens var. hirtella]|nr:K+ transporter 1 [Perilla frutescens var. frutescens]KAH6787624.1 K+ transporter 1 [Perilla frutescens var. hirtella]
MRHLVHDGIANGDVTHGSDVTVPRAKTIGHLQSAVAGADFWAALVAICFLGALPPVDLKAFKAICSVRNEEKLG